MDEETNRRNHYRQLLKLRNLNDLPHSFHCTHMINGRRDILSLKILRGIANTGEILAQLIFEYQVYSETAEKIAKKIRNNEPYIDELPEMANRINSLWNDLYIFCTVEFDILPEHVTLSNSLSEQSLDSNNMIFNRMGAITSLNIEVDENRFAISGVKCTKAACFPPPDFIGILQEVSFIDKTLLIKEVLRPEEHRAIIVNAPRKYGRTTIVSMLKYFLEIQIDSAGKPVTKAIGDEAVVDTSNYALFKGLKIFDEKDIMDQHFGKYPVLHVDFMNINAESLSAVISSCKDVLHLCYKWHSYLKYSAALKEQQKNKCRTWCDEKAYKKLKSPAVAYGLKSLSKYLSKHYEKPCFVLVDGYDTIIMPTVMKREWYDKTNKIYDFVRKMLSFLKLDGYYGRAFLTGKSAMASSGIVPQCVKLYKFSEYHEYNEYYGFTPGEVRYLFNKPELEHLHPLIKDLQSYYGGFNKLNYETLETKQMYCMWSILSVIKRNRVQNYWKEFGHILCSVKIPLIQAKLHYLLQNGTMLLEEYDTSTRVFSTNVLRSHKQSKSMHFFLNFLLDIGYLTCIRHRMSENNPNKQSKVLHIKFPNIEVKQDITEKLRVLSISSIHN